MALMAVVHVAAGLTTVLIKSVASILILFNDP
jgi:hypothetical protein